MMRLAIVDRDGVINYDRPDHVKSPEEWEPIPGSLEAVARLNRAGYRVIVVSNQSGLGRGLFGIDTLHAIHEKMERLLKEAGGVVDALFFCPHRPDEGCECRKPGTGLFREIAWRYRTRLQAVPVIGDSRRDVDAAIGCGARPILVRTGRGTETLSELTDCDGVTLFSDLAAAVDGLESERV